MIDDIIWYIQRLETLNHSSIYAQGFEDAKKTILEFVEKKKKEQGEKEKHEVCENCRNCHSIGYMDGWGLCDCKNDIPVELEYTCPYFDEKDDDDDGEWI